MNCRGLRQFGRGIEHQDLRVMLRCHKILSPQHVARLVRRA